MNKFALPASMIFAAVLICGAYIYAEGSPIKDLKIISKPAQNNEENIKRNRPDFDVDPRRVEHSWVRGSEAASVTIVEFSDLECVFCQQLHPTLSELLALYPDKVNWEFRHFPLVIHLNARPAALASECVGELAGNEAFWEFTDFLFANQKSFGPALYEEGAALHDVDAADLTACMQRQDISDRLLADEQIAMTVGVNGTPHSIIVFEDGTMKPVSGALPLAEWIKLIEK